MFVVSEHWKTNRFELKNPCGGHIQRVHTQSWTGHSETFNKSTTRPTWTSHTLF